MKNKLIIFIKITPFLVDYDTTILTNLTLYLGFIFAVLVVYKIDNFCYWLIQVIKLIKDTYSESYHKAFKQSYNKQNFTTFNTQIIKDILNDALCFFYSYYKIHTTGHIPPIVDIVPLVQEAKKKKIDTIHYRKLFKTGINDRHIDKCVDIFYDKYSPQHDTPAIDRTYKEIIKLMLKNRKTEFNDFIDILNFVMPAQLCIAEKGTIYFTNEDKWNDIIKLNKSDNDFFENCFNFQKLITE